MTFVPRRISPSIPVFVVSRGLRKPPRLPVRGNGPHMPENVVAYPLDALAAKPAGRLHSARSTDARGKAARRA